jgi:hypothetical protein
MEVRYGRDEDRESFFGHRERRNTFWATNSEPPKNALGSVDPDKVTVRNWRPSGELPPMREFTMGLRLDEIDSQEARGFESPLNLSAPLGDYHHPGEPESDEWLDLVSIVMAQADAELEEKIRKIGLQPSRDCFMMAPAWKELAVDRNYIFASGVDRHWETRHHQGLFLESASDSSLVETVVYKTAVEVAVAARAGCIRPSEKSPGDTSESEDTEGLFQTTELVTSAYHRIGWCFVRNSERRIKIDALEHMLTGHEDEQPGIGKHEPEELWIDPKAWQLGKPIEPVR